MSSRSSIILLSVLTLISLAILITLGTWQLQRKTWKEGLIARLEERSALPALSFAQARALWEASPSEAEFRRVNVSGLFRHDQEQYLISAQTQGAAWQVITPLQTGQRTVLVVRGIVPDPLKNPASRPNSQPAGDVTLDTRIRLSEVPTAFSPQNAVSQKNWYWRDGEAMRAQVSLANGFEHVPFFLEVITPTAEWPRPDPQGVNLRNPHLMYALTWFGLALTLVGVYSVVMYRSFRH